MRPPRSRRSPVLLVALAASVAGCASVPARPGFEGVQERTAAAGAPGATWPQSAEERNAIDAEVAALLARPLSVEDAVRVALLRNPALQARYERLGVAGADLVEAGLLQNPTFAGAFMPGLGPISGTRKVEMELTQSLLQLLLLPSRKAIESQRFEGVQLDVAAEVLDVAARTRAAWVALVAQQNLLAALAVMEEGAAASAELAERLHAAGNVSELVLTQEQGLAEEARLARVAAEAALAEPREALARWMGLGAGEAAWSVPDRLPGIPHSDPVVDPSAPAALDARLDIAAGRRFATALSEAVALQRRLRFIPFLDAGVASSLEPGEGWTVGPALVVELPIFQQGQPALARLEAELRRTEAETTALDVEARASAREALARLRATRELADRYREQTIPLRQRTTALALRHYNYMLIGAFDVLEAKRDELAAYVGYVDAVRGWWTSLADLERALGRRVAVDAPGAAPQIVGLPPGAQPAAPPAVPAADACQGEHCAHEGHDHAH